MRGAIFSLAACLLIAACVSCEKPAPAPVEPAPTLAARDRSFALSALHASRKLFLDAVADLSEEQWRFKPAPDRWSIAEVAEHVTKVEGTVFQQVTEELVKTELKPGIYGEKEDQEMLAFLRDRTQRAEAPAPLRPDRRWQDQTALLAEFRGRREKTLDFIRETELPLRQYYGPPRGTNPPMDAYQHILMLAGHLERHVQQIEEIKDNKRYPTK